MLLSTLTLASLALATTAVAKNKTTLPPIPRDRSTPVQQRLAFEGEGKMSVSWSSQYSSQSLHVSSGEILMPAHLIRSV